MRYISLMLVIFITGCVSTRPIIQVDPDSQINEWQMKGRLAATIGKDGGSATFIWSKDKENHQIELYGPLGSGRVILSQANGQASIQDKDSLAIGDNLEQVLFENIGWLVPFEAINHWITGKPKPDSDVNKQQYDSASLIGFEQAGWQVEYNRFKAFADRTIPSKITIVATPDYLAELSQNLGKDISKVSVKLIIKEFSGS